MSYQENREHCACIAETLERIAEGIELDEEGEELSIYDYMEQALDFELTIGSDGIYRAGRVMVAFGGPTIWVNTRSKQVELYWWNEYADYPISDEAASMVDDLLIELSEGTTVRSFI